MKKEKVLVLKSNYNGQEIWNFPGGKVEEGETFEETATREVFEECNLKIKNLKRIEKGKYQIHDKLWNGMFFYTQFHSGTLKNCEPHKIQQLAFLHKREILSLPSLPFLLYNPLKKASFIVNS